MKLSVVLLGLFSVQGRSPQERVVGGFRADWKKYPWMVSLHYFDLYRCGGVAYKRNLVITAAHCMYHDGLSVWKIGVPTSADMKDALMFDVKKRIAHPAYEKSTLAYDAAIWKPAKLLPAISAQIELAPRVKKDELLSIIGWGRTFKSSSLKKKRPSISKALRESAVPVIADTTCLRIYDNVDLESQFCAGFLEGGPDACEGDSGGPIFKGNVLYGIMSSGAGCAEKESPGVYTRAEVAQDLINRYIGTW